ncbi:MAG: response regulator [Chloroflexota bacterium]
MKKPGTKTVLVIEDEAEIRKFACRVLELEGYRVLDAGDGDRGLALLRESAVDLVLLDLRLPVRDGWSVLAHLKSEPEMATVPVIIFTATAGRSQHERARRLGAAGYLVKPLSAGSLKRAVSAITYPDKGGKRDIRESAHYRRR